MTEPYPISDWHPLIRDRGRGPELVNSRITVFDLLPNLLDPTQTEADVLAEFPTLTQEQVAAVRAYALEYAERLLPEQRAWEARPERRNPPEVEARWAEAAPRIRERMRRHRLWLAVRERGPDGEYRPTLEEWLAAPEPDDLADLISPANPPAVRAGRAPAGAAVDG